MTGHNVELNDLTELVLSIAIGHNLGFRIHSKSHASMTQTGFLIQFSHMCEKLTSMNVHNVGFLMYQKRVGHASWFSTKGRKVLRFCDGVTKVGFSDAVRKVLHP
jgi:hypothetical protein